MLIPSIDLQNGQAVQLRQGKTLELIAADSPQELAARFNRFGQVAVIDLDAALETGDNLELIRQLCRVADVRAGGGIRTVERGEALLRAGAKKIIVGTAATPDFLGQFHPSQVMVALDHNLQGQVLDKGWTNNTGESLYERAERLAPYCSGFLCTFVENEGCLGGVSLEAVKALTERLPHPVTIAGGVKSTKEAAALCRLGVDVQVGMALYKGLLDPAEVLAQTLDFDKGDGLIPTVVQDADSRDVLMLAYSNKESLLKALNEGRGVYHSRSRNELWEKGASSGHTQQLLSCRYDCDRDTLLFIVRQQGPCCHTGSPTCFGEKTFNLPMLFNKLEERHRILPEGSYTAMLFQNKHKLHKKIIEEAFEATQATSHAEFAWEIADAVFFLSMLAVSEGLSWADIERELAGRRR